jgi:hypothetical protein
MNDNQLIAFRHFDFSDNFFDLVEAVLKESIKHGNDTFGVFSPDADFKKEYKELTKWSDSRIMIPILFNFFHGIELYLKGAIYLIDAPQGNSTHKLSKHLETFKNHYPSKTKLIETFSYYIYPEEICKILFDFYKTNRIANSSEFYEVFKYPYTRKFLQSFNFKDLRNTEESGIAFFNKLLLDIEIMRNEKKSI